MSSCKASLQTASMYGVSLQTAAKAWHEDLVRNLLQHGAAVGSAGSTGETALHVAARCNHSHVAALLLQAGAVPVLRTHSGHTALHTAAMYGSVAAVEVLCQHMSPAQVEGWSHSGWSALFMATACQYTEVVSALLKSGKADPMAPSNQDTVPWPFGRTRRTLPAAPFLFATARGFVAVVGSILQHAPPQRLTTSALIDGLLLAGQAANSSSNMPHSESQHQQMLHRIVQAIIDKVAADPDDTDLAHRVVTTLSKGTCFSACWAVVGALLDIHKQTFASMQAREAGVRAQEEDVAAEMTALQHLILSTAAAKKRQHVGSKSARRGGWKQQCLGAFRSAAVVVIITGGWLWYTAEEAKVDLSTMRADSINKS